MGLNTEKNEATNQSKSGVLLSAEEPHSAELLPTDRSNKHPTQKCSWQSLIASTSISIPANAAHFTTKIFLSFHIIVLNIRIKDGKAVALKGSVTAVGIGIDQTAIDQQNDARNVSTSKISPAEIISPMDKFSTSSGT
ncbi:hypothetical protein LOAG_01829 [Loa loa]|uniref:Uncharacterized protein n=1 Tax=Loa loa TaxID=7209 RepID=A0A1S0UA12_LOALO|nr:hypothetical protein LOAG_01829 [Loa loa]EFO26649.1 hypothetical protein LOAG_01829 [Loa loa]